MEHLAVIIAETLTVAMLLTPPNSNGCFTTDTATSLTLLTQLHTWHFWHCYTPGTSDTAAHLTLLTPLHLWLWHCYNPDTSDTAAHLTLLALIHSWHFWHRYTSDSDTATILKLLYFWHCYSATCCYWQICNDTSFSWLLFLITLASSTDLHVKLKNKLLYCVINNLTQPKSRVFLSEIFLPWI